MRRALILVIAFAAVQCDEDGKYHPDNTGRYQPAPGDDGRYIPDNSGQYIPDDSGLYNPDGTGIYSDDGTGRYSGQDNRYRHEGYIYRQSGNGKNGGYRQPSIPSPNAINDQFSNPIPAGSFESKTFEPKPNKQGKEGAGFGNSPAAASHNPTKRFPTTGFPTAKYNQGRYDDGRWRIIKQSGDVSGDGYHWEYETENGIVAEEAGQLANKGTDAEGIRSKGFFKYTGPDNVVYSITYTADENGFVAQGNHLPTPPPLPVAIIKSLELQRAAGKLL